MLKELGLIGLTSSFIALGKAIVLCHIIIVIISVIRKNVLKALNNEIGTATETVMKIK